MESAYGKAVMERQRAAVDYYDLGMIPRIPEGASPRATVVKVVNWARNLATYVGCEATFYVDQLPAGTLGGCYVQPNPPVIALSIRLVEIARRGGFTQEDWDLITGVTLHELGHAKYSRELEKAQQYALRASPLAYIGMPEMLLQSFEDERVETALGQEIPALKAYLQIPALQCRPHMSRSIEEMPAKDSILQARSLCYMFVRAPHLYEQAKAGLGPLLRELCEELEAIPLEVPSKEMDSVESTLQVLHVVEKWASPEMERQRALSEICDWIVAKLPSEEESDKEGTGENGFEGTAGESRQAGGAGSRAPGDPVSAYGAGESPETENVENVEDAESSEAQDARDAELRRMEAKLQSAETAAEATAEVSPELLEKQIQALIADAIVKGIVKQAQEAVAEANQDAAQAALVGGVGAGKKFEGLQAPTEHDLRAIAAGYQETPLVQWSTPKITPDVKARYTKDLAEVRHHAQQLSGVFKVRRAQKLVKIRERRTGKISGRALSRARISPLLFETKELRLSIGVDITLLIDCSGSMAGRKMTQARKVAVLLTEAMSRVGAVQLRVFGHSTGDADIDSLGVTAPNKYANTSEIFKLYDPVVDGKNAARLGAMEAGNANYDGVAIQAVSELICKEADSDSEKWLIVVSDGAPCGYGQESGVETAKKAVAKARRHGVKVLAVQIEGRSCDEIYGEAHVEKFTDHAKLVVDMKKLVLKILRNSSESV